MVEFQAIVENAKLIAKLKKHIKFTTVQFMGKTSWLHNNADHEYQSIPFSSNTPVYTRFLTITYDTKKFTANEISRPQLLINYFKNAMSTMKELFESPPVIIMEFTKLGVVHWHINYQCPGVLEHMGLILRCKYLFCHTLRDRQYAVHDRYFNDNGKAYLRKANTHYITFKD